MSDDTFILTQQVLLKNSKRFKRRIESKLSYQFSIPVLFTISKLPNFRILLVLIRLIPLSLKLYI